MNLLSLDSATSLCAACVWTDDGGILAMATERMDRGQDARIVPLALEVMAQANLGWDAIDRIAAPSGPGSFTGLRVALAAARGLALAADRPVFGVDRFSIHREQQKTHDGPLLIVLESRRAELFAALYDPAMSEPFMAVPGDIAARVRDMPNLMVVGDAADKLKPFMASEARYAAETEPEVLTAARLASTVAEGDGRFAATPCYIRPPDVTMPRVTKAP